MPAPIVLEPALPVPMVPWLLMPGLLVVPPPAGPMVVLVEELLSRGVLLVVPTLPVGLAPPELTVPCAEVPVWACAGRQRRAVPAIKAVIVTIRAIIASPLSCVVERPRQTTRPAAPSWRSRGVKRACQSAAGLISIGSSGPIKRSYSASGMP